jgi:hypothetical protein
MVGEKKEEEIVQIPLKNEAFDSLSRVLEC